MKKKVIFLAFLFLSVMAFSYCGGGGGGGGNAPTVSQPLPYIAAFTQSVASNTTGTYNEIFPGQANIWSLDADFALLGYALVDRVPNQNDLNYALALKIISSQTSSTGFPGDQSYSNLAFNGPLMTAADGVKVAVASSGATISGSLPLGVLSGVKAGSYAAFLNATSDSRLQQTLDLTSLPSGTTVKVSWCDAVSLDPGIIPGYNPSYNVLIRSEAGAPLQQNPMSTLGNNYLARSPHCWGPFLFKTTGQKIVLSFEESSSTGPGDQSYAIIDSVSVKDAAGTEYVQNGGFELADPVTGDHLYGWTTNTPAESQNVTSGSRTIEGLKVTRSFYTVPNKLWGRWVDLFENAGNSDVTKTIVYETTLGSDGYGIIYDPVSGSTGTPKALSSWDSSYNLFGDGNRDVGLVFGNATSVDFSSYSNTYDLSTSPSVTQVPGSDVIDVTYIITVPAHGSAAIVNFFLMDGTDTGQSASVLGVDLGTGETAVDTTTPKATEIDTEANNIVNNFRTNPQYMRGMTQQQIDAIKNF